MNDNPTKACNGCGIPVELAALKTGGLCPNCAPNDNGWEVDYDADAGLVTHLLDLNPEIDGFITTCEIVVFEPNHKIDCMTWEVCIQLDSAGDASELSVKTARLEGLRKAIDGLRQLTDKLEATYEREASN